MSASTHLQLPFSFKSVAIGGLGGLSVPVSAFVRLITDWTKSRGCHCSMAGVLAHHTI